MCPCLLGMACNVKNKRGASSCTLHIAHIRLWVMIMLSLVMLVIFLAGTATMFTFKFVMCRCVFCGHNKKLMQSMSHCPDNKFRTFDLLNLQFSLHCFQRRNRPLERQVHTFTSSKCASAIGLCFEFNGLFWISVVWVYYQSILFFEFNGLFCVSILYWSWQHLWLYLWILLYELYTLFNVSSKVNLVDKHFAWRGSFIFLVGSLVKLLQIWSSRVTCLAKIPL